MTFSANIRLQVTQQLVYAISYLGDVLSGVLVVSGLVAEDSPMSTGL